MTQSAVRWSVRWRSVGHDATEHIIYENRLPVLFCTRVEARAWIDQTFGYIRNRKDLRSAPFGWRMPQPIRVKVIEVGQVVLEAV